MSDISFRVVDASSAEAVGAMRSSFAELDDRFEGGFAIGSALDDAGVWMNPPHGRFLVADRDGRVVGCGGAQRLDASTVEIERMWVDTSVRGIGLGKRLLARLEAEAGALGRARGARHRPPVTHRSSATPTTPTPTTGSRNPSPADPPVAEVPARLRMSARISAGFRSSATERRPRYPFWPSSGRQEGRGARPSRRRDAPDLLMRGSSRS